MAVASSVLLVALAGCIRGDGGNTGASTSTATSVRPGTTTQDIELLHSIVAEVVTSANFEVTKTVTDTKDFGCTGTSREVNSGRSAQITLVVGRSSDDREALGKVAVELQKVSERYFGGRATIVNDSSNPRGSVRLRADGFTLEVDDSVGPSGLSLSAAGPCRF